MANKKQFTVLLFKDTENDIGVSGQNKYYTVAVQLKHRQFFFS